MFLRTTHDSPLDTSHCYQSHTRHLPLGTIHCFMGKRSRNLTCVAHNRHTIEFRSPEKICGVGARVLNVIDPGKSVNRLNEGLKILNRAKGLDSARPSEPCTQYIYKDGPRSLVSER